MKPLGARKTRTPIGGHQYCPICHSEVKGGRAADKVAWLREVLDALPIDEEHDQFLRRLTREVTAKEKRRL